MWKFVKMGKKGTLLIFKDLDFRPSNGPDIRLCFRGVVIPEKGNYTFEADYITSQPEVLHSPVATATFEGVTTVSDFTVLPYRHLHIKRIGIYLSLLSTGQLLVMRSL